MFHSFDVVEFLCIQAHARSWENKDEQYKRSNLVRQVDADKAVSKMNLIKSRVLEGRVHEKKLEEK